jgi:hypothetical protein
METTVNQENAGAHQLDTYQSDRSQQLTTRIKKWLGVGLGGLGLMSLSALFWPVASISLPLYIGGVIAGLGGSVGAGATLVRDMFRKDQ